MANKFDITKHEFVPKHVKLSEKEIAEILQHFNISKKQLPAISKNDPAIQHLNVEGGEVIKIIRKSETAGESFFYRVVRSG